MQMVQVGQVDRTTTRLGYRRSSRMGGKIRAQSLSIHEVAVEAARARFTVRRLNRVIRAGIATGTPWNLRAAA